MKIKLTPAEAAVDAIRKIEAIQVRRNELVRMHRTANGAQRMLIVGKIAELTDQIRELREAVEQTEGRHHAS